MVERLYRDLSESDDRAVSAFMSELASQSAAAVPPLPGADIVWVRAQLVSRWAAERRAERPLETMQILHIGLGLVAALVLFVWSAPALLGLLR